MDATVVALRRENDALRAEVAQLRARLGDAGVGPRPGNGAPFDVPTERVASGTRKRSGSMPTLVTRSRSPAGGGSPPTGGQSPKRKRKHRVSMAPRFDLALARELSPRGPAPPAGAGGARRRPSIFALLRAPAEPAATPEPQTAWQVLELMPELQALSARVTSKAGVLKSGAARRDRAHSGGSEDDAPSEGTPGGDDGALALVATDGRADYTVEDAKQMAAALMLTVQNFAGNAQLAVEAWAIAAGLHEDDANDANDDDDGDGDGEVQSLPVPVVMALVRAIVDDVVRLKKMARWGMAARMLGGLLLTYTDLVTDIFVALQFLADPELEGWAFWTFGSIVVSLVVQAFCAVILQPGQLLAFFAGLTGFKPIVDTWRVISGAPRPPGQVWSADAVLATSRMVEILLESLPQAVLQSFVLVHSAAPTTLQLVSLVGSCATTGYILAMTDFDLDHNKRMRRSEPTLYGIFPSRTLSALAPHGGGRDPGGHAHAGRRKIAMFFGDMLLITGHNAARVLAVAVALTATLPGLLVPAWVLCEWALFNAVRHFEARSWRWCFRRRDGVFMGFMLNTGCYLIITTAPFLWWRLPFFCSPHIWLWGIVAAAFSNAALMYVALEVVGDGAKIGLLGMATTAPWMLLLAACVAVSAAGFLLVWLNMVPALRHTLYRRRTVRQHVELTLWGAGTYTGRHGHGLTDSRGRILSVFARRYWPPKAKVRAWAQAHWAEWEDPATRPRWLTEKWARAARDWLPGELHFPVDPPAARGNRHSSWRNPSLRTRLSRAEGTPLWHRPWRRFTKRLSAAKVEPLSDSS